MVHCGGTTRFQRRSSRPSTYSPAGLIQSEDGMRSEELLDISPRYPALQFVLKRVILFPLRAQIEKCSEDYEGWRPQSGGE